MNLRCNSETLDLRRKMAAEVKMAVDLEAPEKLGPVQLQEQKVIAKTLIPAGTILYQGYPILNYQGLESEDDPNLMAALSLIQGKELKDLYSRMSVLYPRTPAEILARAVTVYPGVKDPSRFPDILKQPYQMILIWLYCNIFREGASCFLYLQASRWNHSCYANCFHRIDNQILTIRSTREILPGTECTLSYWATWNLPGDRRKRIKLMADFNCQCEVCTGKLPEAKIEEYRLQVIKLDPVPTCSGCKQVRLDLKRCSRCRKVRYCSRECQRLDYKNHRRQCSP